MIWLLWACHKPVVEAPEPIEPLPIAAHIEAEAEALLWNPDNRRGGPPLKNTQSPLPPFKGVSRKTAKYVGNEPCAGCHAEAYEKWSNTAHAHAMEPLIAEVKELVNREELFHKALLPGVLCVLLQILLSRTLLRRLP